MTLQTAAATPAAATPPPGVWPLSPAQRGLWFLDSFNPGSSFYVISLGVRLRGRLDVDALRAALNDCVAHQAALRTRFVTLDGHPYQVFVPSQPMDLPVLDAGGSDPAGAERFARDRCDLAANTPFDLAGEPLLRAELVRLGADHHMLVVAVHHIVFDGWSNQVLLAELGAAYAARAAGRPPGLPAPRFTVGEYATHSQARLAPGTAGRAAETAHWRALLDGARPLEIPTDFVRPPQRTFAGATLLRELDADLTRGVRRYAAERGVTPFTVLAVAFGLVLAEVSGQRDVLFGVPLAGRTTEETTELIGFLVNTLPLRVDLAGAVTFDGALGRLRTAMLDLLSHQEFSFNALVDDLRPPRSGNRNPFFDMCFQYLPAPTEGADFGGLDVEVEGGRRPTAQFDLSCDVHDRGDVLIVAMEYSTEVFAERTVESFHALFESALRSAVTHPAAAVRFGGPRSAPLVAEPALPRQWHSGGLRGLVTRWAARTPDAVAVVVSGRSWTYRELDEAATGLAGSLTARGVRPGDRVGLLAEPSPWLPVGMLAVLECAAVYVPVDPRTPAPRAAAMMEHTGCGIVLVHDETAEFGATLGPDPVRIDAASTTPAGPGRAVPVVAADAAYVIFTSGSSGRPKAVTIAHAQALTLAAAVASVYGLGPADRVLQMASAAVDVSVEEFFGAWQAGAAVVMHAPARERLDELIAAQRPTVLNLPAGRWHEWAADLTARGADVPGCVRLVIAGSERVDPSTVRAWRTGPGRGVRLLNAYGTTEATVSSVWYDTANLARDAAYTRNTPIGGPLPHVRLYVLDSAGEPVAPGMAGELYIGGPGVGLGYAGDPVATARAFLPDPFGPEPGRRMYRTGDRVRVLASGALDFLGRTDTQVKVRGSRVDLEEVERTATEVPGVARFVADVRGDENAVARLVGYLVPAPDTDRDLAQDRVEQWRVIHDEDRYHAADGATDFNTSGWTSSYTLEPIDAADMREWLDATVARITGTPAGSVLEIGCGTGMIAFRVAPHAARYVGTDIAAGALSYLAGHLSGAGLDPARVRLVQAAADDFEAIGDERFDLIVLNSVAQYFPGLDYLERVLAQAWRRLRPGGRIFLGDIRDVTTLAAFHLSVRLARSGDADPASLAVDIAELAETENELCVAPAWFARLAGTLPGAVAVSEVKRGRAGTEMNRFRYDVSLWKQPRTTAMDGVVRHEGPLNAAEFGSLLDRADGGPLLLTGVPDARSHREVRLAAGLDAPEPDQLPHPDDLIDAATARGYAARVAPAGHGLLTVAVWRTPVDGVPTFGEPEPEVGVPANEPLRAARDRALIAAVREHLARSLPAAMIPTRFVTVDRVPLTVSGKVDRRRLPEPPRSLGDPGGTAATTDTERALCAIWAQALGLATVGIRDNFFEVGGDSITWLQIMSRSTRAGYRFGARDIFDHQTVERLARTLAEREREDAAVPAAEAERPFSAGLTPIQRWFFETFRHGSRWQNQSAWFDLAADCPAGVLSRALAAVAAHHDGLLTRFGGTADGVRQHRAGTAPAARPVREVDLTGLDGRRREEVLRAETARAQSSMDPAEGALFDVVRFRTPQGEPDAVFWCVHHLVVDAVSWQFLGDDLEAAVEALAAGREPVMPPRGADAMAWATWSRDEAARMSEDELAYWRSTVAAGAFALPVRHPDASPTAAAGHVVSRVLPGAARGDLAGEAMLATCLTAVRPVLAAATGTEAGTVWLEFHGRPMAQDAPDIARTVGWFTALFPFLLTAGPGGVRGRLGAVPHGGVGYGRARYLRGERLDTAANVVVNYLPPGAPSQAGTLRPTAAYDDVTAPAVAPDSDLPFAAEIQIGLDRDGSLTVSALLGARYFDRARAEAFADDLAAGLAGQLGDGSRPPAEDRFELLPDAVQTADLAARLRDRPDVVAAYALAPVQRPMLYRHLMNSAEDVNYNEFVLDIAGDLDVGVFRRAWRELGRRHEALRTSFEWSGTPEPVQIVHREAPEPAVHDWSGLPDARERLERLRREQRADPPPLRGAPPFRLTLVTMAPGEHRLVWLDHHILLDGWSSGILVRELADGYADVSAGREPFAGLAVPVRYRDYLRRLRQTSTAQAGAYWRSAFDGFEGPTALPFDAPPSAALAAAGDFHEAAARLDPVLRAGLRELAERAHATVGSLHYAVWSAFLHRWSGRSPVVFGVAQSGRPATLGDVDAMVGMYMSTLPLVVRVDPARTVTELLADVAEQGWRLMAVAGSGSLWDVYDWAGLPVSRALFHSVVVVQKFTSAPAGAEERPLRIELTPSRTVTGFPLTLVVDPDGGEVRLVGDGRSFAPGTLRHVLDAFVELLRATAASPDGRVGDLPAPVIDSGAVAARPARRPADPPRGGTEARVAEAWCAVLGLDRIDRDVNLFEAGATSLSASRLHARLCAEFDASMPLTDMFRYPTVAGLAARFDGADTETTTIRTAAWVARNDRRRQALAAPRGRARRPGHDPEVSDR